MGYRDVIASAVEVSDETLMSADSPDQLHEWNREAADKILKHLTAASFAIVPIEMPQGMFAALLDDYDDRDRSGKGVQGYRDIWSVALKSAQALA